MKDVNLTLWKFGWFGKESRVEIIEQVLIYIKQITYFVIKYYFARSKDYYLEHVDILKT
jgi:hypothetical protein